jgi:hypothetical protein
MRKRFRGNNFGVKPEQFQFNKDEDVLGRGKPEAQVDSETK